MTCSWCSRTNLAPLTAAINAAVDVAVKGERAYFTNGAGERIAGPVCVRCGDVAMRFCGDRAFAAAVIGDQR